MVFAWAKVMPSMGINQGVKLFFLDLKNNHTQ